MDNQLRNAVKEVLPQAIEDLKRLCRQPSVSAQRLGIEECASLLRELLEEAGVEAQMLPTQEGSPVVYAQREGRSPKTLLFYNHYDVQPPDPLDEWLSSPFEPVEREGKLFARGVSDDKGQIIARLAAIKAVIKAKGELPCSVKFCVEGAEEISSPGLPEFVHKHKELLKADACIWEGGGVDWENQPTISLGLKGILYVELECRTAVRDAHSSYATVVPNPAWRLVWALSTLKDSRERVLISGFYDDVRPPNQMELKAVQAMPSEEEALKKSLDLKGFVNDVQGVEHRKRHILEPTCTICGLVSGYIGAGSKTILPATATAKIDFRLVPDQRAQDVLEKLKAHLKDRGFDDIQVRYLGGEDPARTPMDAPWVKLVQDAARKVYGQEPVLVPNMAGSGPMHLFTDDLKLSVASAGIDYPDNHIHAPNENIRLSDFEKGVLHLAEIVERFGAQ